MILCENNHPLGDIEDKAVGLGGCVIHCHKCGYTTTSDTATAFYVLDYVDNGVKYHLYYFYPNLYCKNCGNRQTTYSVVCYTYEESLANYNAYRKASNVVR